VTNRVGMNAAIDDVDFGIPRGAVLSLFVDLRSARSFRRLHRVASRSIVRRVSEQFEVAIFGLSVIGQPATAYGDRPGSEVRRGAGPAARVGASDGSALPSRAGPRVRLTRRIAGNLLKVEPQNE